MRTGFSRPSCFFANRASSRRPEFVGGVLGPVHVTDPPASLRIAAATRGGWVLYTPHADTRAAERNARATSTRVGVLSRVAWVAARFQNERVPDL